MKNIKLISILLVAFMLAAVIFVSCSGNGNGTTEQITTLADDPTEAPEISTEAPDTDEVTTEEPTLTTDAPVDTTDAAVVTTEPAHEHSFGPWNTVKIATCTEEGLAERVCSCGGKETQSIAVIAHRSGEWVTAKEPTCTEDGTKNSLCTVCSTVVSTEKIPALGHVETVLPEKNATCTETGLTAGKSCSVCGSVTVAQTTVPMAPHTPGEWIIDKEATATQTGSKHQACAVCGETLNTEVIPATPHVPGEWIIDKEATCTASGARHRVCTKCGETVDTEVIPVKPHTEVKTAAKAATCTATGLTEGKKCGVCNAVIVEQVQIPVIPHVSGEWIVDKEASCTQKGTRHKACTVCSATTATEDIPAKGHTEVIDPLKEATCTEKGKTEGKHCSVCNTVLTAQKDIPAKGHTETIDYAKNPTCTETGLTAGTHCKVCNAVLTSQNVIPAKGHTEVVDPAKAPTCTEKGLTEGKRCSVCNTVITAQKEVTPTGHKDGEWIIDKEATLTSTGSKHQVCSVCGVTIKTETIPVVVPNQIEYTVTVVDGLSNPMSGIKVSVKSGSTVALEAVTDENGKVTAKLAEGNYDASVEVSDSYYAATVKLTASDTAVEIMAVGYVTGLVKEYPDEANGYYNINSVGSYRVPVQNGVKRYYLFTPGQNGDYKITVDSSDVNMGYYGGGYFLLPNSIAEFYEDGAMKLPVRESEKLNSFIIGLESTSSAVTECTLTIERVGERPLTPEEMEYVQYQLSKPLTKKTATPSGTRVFVEIEVDLTTFANREEIQVVYNEADGYYHLHTADGPILYVVVNQPLAYLQDNSLAGIAGTTSVGKIFYDENGNFIKKEGYNQALAGKKDYSNGNGVVVENGYAQIADSKYGVVPLDADLIHILKNIGDGGWYERGTTEISNWIFGDSIVMPENCWLFAVCYFV